MARTRSIRRSSTRKTSKAKKNQSIFARFLPEEAQAFLARRMVDLFALAMFMLGGFLLLSMLSYNESDPSWNSAAPESAVIANWMGSNGAWASDLILQTLGLGGVFLSLVFIAWGARCFYRQSIRPVLLRFVASLVAALCLSVAFAQVPSAGWLSHPYLGSSAGALIVAKLEGVFSWLPSYALIGFMGVMALTIGLYGAAIRAYEVAIVAQRVAFYARAVIVYAWGLAMGFMSWIKHHNEPGYHPDPMVVLKAFPKFPTPDFTIPAHLAAEKKEMPRKTNIKPATAASSVSSAPSAAASAQAPAQDAAQADSFALSRVPSNIKVVTPQQAMQPQQRSSQKNFSLDGEDWELPPLEFLEAVPDVQPGTQLDENALRKNAELLQNVLADFNVEGEISSIHPGPVVTLYEFEPAPGVKSAKIIGLADDIARSMSAISVRVAVVPGRNVIGIELPNKSRQIVYMRELLESRMFEKSKAGLPLVLGKDIGGAPIMADLAKMPHLLVAGTTGSGKSVAVNTMILSLLYRLSPEKCRFIMIDPKMLELSVYDGIPHLLSPVVTEPGKAVVALKWAVHEMEERYRAMSKLGVRNITGYNERIREALAKGETIMKKVQTGFDPDSGAAIYEDQPMALEELPFIVVIVDEFADLMLVAGKDVENAIQRLAQMARAAGIHLIMATQRPSVDVITGVVKANFPTRISFQVTSKIDSRTILGEGGAEQLLGMGDMLYMAPGGRVTRVHGPFVSDEDVEKVVNDLKSKAEPAYIDSVTDETGLGGSEVMDAMFGGGSSSEGSSVDELYDQAVAIVAREGKASTSFIQRHLQIGYNRAARIIEEMERQGVVSPANATGKRNILISDHSGAV